MPLRSVRLILSNLPAEVANRNGAQKDQATTSFTVSVDKFEKSNPAPYFPANPKTHVGTPYTDVTFTADEKIANLDGSYRTELYLNGAKIATKDEPTISYQPEFMKDEKKDLEVKAYYKSNFMKDYVPIDDQTFKIGPPPFKGVADNDGLTAGEALRVKAAYNLLAPVNGSQYKEIGSDHLDIQSDGYFETTAKKEPGKDGAFFFECEANLTSKAGD